VLASTAFGKADGSHIWLAAVESSAGTVNAMAYMADCSSRGVDNSRISKDSNSWGAARWRVLVLRNGQLQTFFQNPDRDFTVNMPTFVEIAGGSHLEQSLDLNDGTWRSSEKEPVTLTPGDTVLVIYDVPFTPESLKLGVWYGVATTSTVIR
jgi:hypothetical protein